MSDLVPILFQIMRVLAVACLVHAVLTKQEIYWMVMLGLAAFAGGPFSTIMMLVYAFTIFFPSLRGSGRQAGRAVARGVEAIKPLDTRIKEAQERLNDSDTLQNRTDLAALLSRAGRHDEAQTTLQPALGGIYADDPVVLLTTAELALARGQLPEAEAHLSRVDLKTSAATRTHTLTLLARTQEQQGKLADADATYAQAVQGATSEEPRARYAQFLLQQGRKPEAKAMLEQIARAEKQASSIYRKQEREWFNLAEQLRKEVG